MRAPLTIVAASAVVLLACDARVDQFSASLHYICPGQQVQLAWRVTGSGSMKSTPPLASFPDGPVDDEGQATVAPVATTTIVLHVTRFLGHATSSPQELRMLGPSTTPEPLSVSLADSSAGCRDGKVWATVHPQRFSNDLKVATVAPHAEDGRTYDVAHGGVHATVRPGTIATAFAGMPIVGDWILTSTLAPGEACGTPTLPRSLNVDVFAQCSPGDAR